MNWASPDKWLQLKQGVGCPMCEDIHLPENQHSFLIVELEHVIVRLPKNQVLLGWTVVFAKRHVSELFEFSDDELCAFWRSVSLVGEILYSIYQPPKINYCVYGNLIPHVHCHLIPQSYSIEPQMLTVIDSKTEELSEEEYRQMIANIKTQIDKN
jgi:diadenosine tetraphosphate (Ap4A) HIT family hydrolase